MYFCSNHNLYRIPITILRLNFQWKRKTREKSDDFRCLLEVIAVYNQQKRSALVNLIEVIATDVAQLVCFITTMNFNRHMQLVSLYFLLRSFDLFHVTNINKIISLNV